MTITCYIFAEQERETNYGEHVYSLKHYSQSHRSKNVQWQGDDRPPLLPTQHQGPGRRGCGVQEDESLEPCLALYVEKNIDTTPPSDVQFPCYTSVD